MRNQHTGCDAPVRALHAGRRRASDLVDAPPRPSRLLLPLFFQYKLLEDLSNAVYFFFLTKVNTSLKILDGEVPGDKQSLGRRSLARAGLSVSPHCQPSSHTGAPPSPLAPHTPPAEHPCPLALEGQHGSGERLMSPPCVLTGCLSC